MRPLIFSLLACPVWAQFDAVETYGHSSRESPFPGFIRAEPQCTKEAIRAVEEELLQSKMELTNSMSSLSNAACIDGVTGEFSSVCTIEYGPMELVAFADRCKRAYGRGLWRFDMHFTCEATGKAYNIGSWMQCLPKNDEQCAATVAQSHYAAKCSVTNDQDVENRCGTDSRGYVLSACSITSSMMHVPTPLPTEPPVGTGAGDHGDGDWMLTTTEMVSLAGAAGVICVVVALSRFWFGCFTKTPKDFDQRLVMDDEFDFLDGDTAFGHNGAPKAFPRRRPSSRSSSVADRFDDIRRSYLAEPSPGAVEARERQASFILDQLLAAEAGKGPSNESFSSRLQMPRDPPVVVETAVIEAGFDSKDEESVTGSQISQQQFFEHHS